jgi:hypothetical protein
MAVTYTLTQVGKTNVVGNRKQKTYDLTADTGTYVTGGNTFTASQFGLKKFDFVGVGSVVTGGTAGATANPLGVIYNSTNTGFTLQQYESAATGLPELEKTSAEATVANFTVRLFVIGY